MYQDYYKTSGLSESQSRKGARRILPERRCLHVLIFNGLFCNGMIIVERHHAGVRPEHPLVRRNNHVRPVWIAGESLGGKWHEAGHFISPSVLDIAVPEWEIAQM